MYDLNSILALKYLHPCVHCSYKMGTGKVKSREGGQVNSGLLGCVSTRGLVEVHCCGMPPQFPLRLLSPSSFSPFFDDGKTKGWSQNIVLYTVVFLL